jgi:hypothetical protein
MTMPASTSPMIVMKRPIPVASGQLRPSAPTSENATNALMPRPAASANG